MLCNFNFSFHCIIASREKFILDVALYYQYYIFGIVILHCGTWLLIGEYVSYIIFRYLSNSIHKYCLFCLFFHTDNMMGICIGYSIKWCVHLHSGLLLSFYSQYVYFQVFLSIFTKAQDRPNSTIKKNVKNHFKIITVSGVHHQPR